ncbi:hypothetical protein V8G54_002447, partial [Vigna mungo]
KETTQRKNSRGGAATTTSRERKIRLSCRSHLPSCKNELTPRSERESSLNAKHESKLEKKKRRFAPSSLRGKTKREDGCFPLLVKPRQRSEEENKILAEKTPRARE